MRYLKISSFLLIVAFCYLGCGTNNDFLVEKGSVGGITSKTTLEDLTQLFEDDSIGVVDDNVERLTKTFGTVTEDYLVYSKSGEKLLEVSFKSLNDSIKVVRSVQLYSDDYETKEGISLESKFKDIVAHFKLGKVETTLTSVTVFVEELNATISIDKQELGLDIFSREKINLNQIPENAKIKFITIWFE